MSSIPLQSLVNFHSMTESNRTEYKRQLTDGLEREVIAFLNYHDGGVIYIGIEKDGKAIGLPDADGTQLAIKDRIKHNIQPSALGLFDVILDPKDGKPVIKIILASGTEKPYYLRKYGMSEKGCFMRLGSATEPMPAAMIEELFARRTRNSLTRIRSPRQNLTFAQLKIYYQEAGLTLNDKFATSLELLTEGGEYNYAAYLLADENGNSTQVAKYSGNDRVDLIERKEYGYCCLVKTCKSALDQLEGVENRIRTQITPRERIENPLWNPVALREAVINAIIHNDYSTELVPKFEIFNDRLEITSAGAVHPGPEREDFFAGYSMPRNKALMRVFKDLGMVEYLGSGMPRILKVYPQKAFTFSSRFVRLCMPMAKVAPVTRQVTRQVTGQVTGQVAGLIGVLQGTMSRKELMAALNLSGRENFEKLYLRPALAAGYIEMTLPQKPNSRLQRYRLTEKGRVLS